MIINALLGNIISFSYIEKKVNSFFIYLNYVCPIKRLTQTEKESKSGACSKYLTYESTIAKLFTLFPFQGMNHRNKAFL